MAIEPALAAVLKKENPYGFSPRSAKADFFVANIRLKPEAIHKARRRFIKPEAIHAAEGNSKNPEAAGGNSCRGNS